MKTFSHAADMQAASLSLRNAGKRIGLVPTMGALHEGHLSLVRRARRENDIVVVSIFVNPTQFGPQEDYRNYPRDLERDSRVLAREGVDLVFAPPVEEMYPPDFQSYTTVEEVSAPLEGEFRKGHFRGVATVVLKLFNRVQPQRAYFGQKDAQQCVVVRQLVRDLNLPVEIVVCPIVRERDGLAMSSRNAYLSVEERQAATVLYRGLVRARELIQGGERRTDKIVKEMRRVIEEEPRARIDYVAAVDAERLHPLARLAPPALIALAVRIGRARLIDNMLIEGTRDSLIFRL